MNYDSYYRQTPTLNTGEYVIDTKRGDVTGDGVNDDIYLLGTKTGGIAVSNVRVYVHNGRTGQNNYINLKTNKGYGPSIFVGDFTNDKTDDILISMSSGSTGLEGYYYIYKLDNANVMKVFDYENFNQQYTYDVVYQNNFTIKVISRFNDKVFTLNLANKGNAYLSALYNNDGTLKKPLKGIVTPLIELNHVLKGTNGGYDLFAVQRIIGYYNADVLGTIVTPLRWNGSQFVLTNNNQYLG
jgi:hypothetical protein